MADHPAEFQIPSIHVGRREVAQPQASIPPISNRHIDGVYKATGRDGEEVVYCVQVEPKGLL
ncbi:MAG: hypothetical protein ACLR4Z_12700 [Butyricicoccaceae bacterium]